MSARGRSKRAKPPRETDEDVRGNIPPDLIPLFNRVRGTIAARWDRSRTEAFLQFAHENPGAELEAIERMAAIKQAADLEAELDFYETPAWATLAGIPHFGPLTGRRVVDAGCGTGAIGAVVAEFGAQVVGIEADRRRAEEARAGGLEVLETDFLTWAPDRPADIVVSNPPYRRALEFVIRALSIAPVVAMLLRLPWLASQKRAAWHSEHPAFIGVLPRRPSFTGDNRTDATDYAWFMWGIEGAGRWAILKAPRRERVPF